MRAGLTWSEAAGVTIADALAILEAAAGRTGEKTATTFVSLRKRRPRTPIRHKP